MITFIKPKEKIYCKSCYKEMDYWIVGLPIDEYEHPECAGKRMADESLKEFKRLFVVKEEKG